MPLTNPQGFLIKCDWIEPSVPRRRANLFILPIFYFCISFFSLNNKVFVGKEDLLTVYSLHYAYHFPNGGAFETWKHPNKMENFHPISRAANQRALTQITSVILMMTIIKDLFSSQALFLITLICRGNKWILTKCKRGGMHRGLVWQKVCGVRLKRFLGVKWLLWWGMAYNYQWNEISWLQVPSKYSVWSNYLVRFKSVICSDTLASSIWVVSLVYLPVLQQMNRSIV